MVVLSSTTRRAVVTRVMSGVFSGRLTSRVNGLRLYSEMEKSGGDQEEQPKGRLGRYLARERFRDTLDEEVRSVVQMPTAEHLQDIAELRSEGVLFNDEFDHDEITYLGHRMLDVHRRRRHYNRIATYEMPLLSQMRHEQQQQNENNVLQFRYTSYLGETHPSERKVVVSFRVTQLPNMSEAERHKLRLLSGSRFDPIEDVVKISCETFPQPAQNKRFLSDLVDRLIAAAKKPNAEDFKDIPLDLRHVKAKKLKAKPQFPREWERPQDAPGYTENQLSIEEQKQADMFAKFDVLLKRKLAREARRVEYEMMSKMNEMEH